MRTGKKRISAQVGLWIPAPKQVFVIQKEVKNKNQQVFDSAQTDNLEKTLVLRDFTLSGVEVFSAKKSFLFILLSSCL